jgi:hypothetical protein
MSGGKSGGIVKGIMVVVAGIGLFIAKGGDNLFRAGSKAVRHADDIGNVGRHLDDVPISGLRHGDEFGAAADSARRAIAGDASLINKGNDSGSLTGDITEGSVDAAEIAVETLGSDDDSDE